MQVPPGERLLLAHPGRHRLGGVEGAVGTHLLERREGVGQEVAAKRNRSVGVRHGDLAAHRVDPVLGEVQQRRHAGGLADELGDPVPDDDEVAGGADAGLELVGPGSSPASPTRSEPVLRDRLSRAGHRLVTSRR
jgi:hypothetical protein